MSTLAGRPGCPRRGVSRAGAIARVTTCLTVTVTLAGTAVAQTAAQPAPAPQPTAVTAGWNEGFFLQTPNGDNRLQIGFVAQADGRFALDNPLPITNTFVMRKVRPTFTGRVAKFIDFKIMPELAGTVVLLDGYFDIRFSPKLRLRSGKDKTPVGYELLISDAYLIFPERSVVSLLVPNRDVGFQAQGDLAGGKLVYPAASSTATRPTARAPRLTSTPTTARISQGASSGCPSGRRHRTRSPTSASIFGGSTGTQTGALPSFRTSAGQTFLSFPATTTADGRRNRVTPAAFLYIKGFGGFAQSRPLDAGHPDERRSANRHQPSLGRDGLVRAHGRSDLGTRPRVSTSSGRWRPSSPSRSCCTRSARTRR